MFLLVGALARQVCSMFTCLPPVFGENARRLRLGCVLVTRSHCAVRMVLAPVRMVGVAPRACSPSAGTCEPCQRLRSHQRPYRIGMPDTGPRPIASRAPASRSATAVRAPTCTAPPSGRPAPLYSEKGNRRSPDARQVDVDERELLFERRQRQSPLPRFVPSAMLEGTAKALTAACLRLGPLPGRAAPSPPDTPPGRGGSQGVRRSPVAPLRPSIARAGLR